MRYDDPDRSPDPTDDSPSRRFRQKSKYTRKKKPRK
jgi:hypothetical protein